MTHDCNTLVILDLSKANTNEIKELKKHRLYNGAIGIVKEKLNTMNKNDIIKYRVIFPYDNVYLSYTVSENIIKKISTLQKNN